MAIHNTGPATRAVAFHWSPAKPFTDYCASDTYFAADERRVVNVPCPQADLELPEGTEYFSVVLTLDQYERTNWREVWMEEARSQESGN